MRSGCSQPSKRRHRPQSQQKVVVENSVHTPVYPEAGAIISQIDLVAIIFPKEGKADGVIGFPPTSLVEVTNPFAPFHQIVELLNKISIYVKANEPGTLKYEVNKEVNKKSGAVEIIMMESYKYKAAIAAHWPSEQFKAFGKKLKDEDLIAKPMQLKVLKNVGASRRGYEIKGS